MAKDLIEIDFQTPQNRDVFFHPIRDSLRGRRELLRSKNPDEIKLHNVHGAPESLPGCRVRVDVESRQGFIIDLISEDVELTQWVNDHPIFELRPKLEVYANILPDEWLWWMNRYVANGKAKLVQGSFPKVINYRPPENRHEPRPKSMQEKIDDERINDVKFALSWAQATTAQKDEVLAGSI